jgi:phage-related protein
MPDPVQPKPLVWIGSSRKDLKSFCTVRLSEAVFALHAFQKKSTTGIATRKQDVDLVRQRLKQAEALHRQEYGK